MRSSPTRKTFLKRKSGGPISMAGKIERMLYDKSKNEFTLVGKVVFSLGAVSFMGIVIFVLGFVARSQ